MLDWQNRVITEEMELEERLLRLTTFIQGSAFAGLPPAEQARLHLQSLHVRGYLAVLKERIAAFGV